MAVRDSSTRGQAEFTAWISPHLEALYRTAWRFTGHPQDAEDLVQELLLRLYQKSAHRRVLEKPGTWLLRALHNLFVDRWRHTRNKPLGNVRYLAQTDLQSMPQPDEAGPDRQAELRELNALISDALHSLPREFRAILVLHDMEGHTMDELASLLGLPLGTVKSRLFRARRHMRALLRAGGNPSGGYCVMDGELKLT